MSIHSQETVTTAEAIEMDDPNAEDDDHYLKNGIQYGKLERAKIDFILVWTNRAEEGNSEKAKEMRHVFENNLRKEGLILENLPPEVSGLSFVKIHAPQDVLKRYAEILKLRVPMKKFDHISEIRVESFRIPIVTDVVKEMHGWIGKLLDKFNYDERKFPRRTNELTATFSRDKEYLFDLDRPELFTPSNRSRIIEFILKRKRLSEDVHDEFAFGIDRALADGIYTAAYPLHDGTYRSQGSTRKLLYDEWASFSKMLKYQPLDAVRDYYGVKIALYFAWLGFYTSALVPPAIAGLLCFLYGVFSMPNDLPSQEICTGPLGNVSICPACDHFCDYWELKETCLHSKIMYLFDNPTTVFFAIFMSFWAALFLEFWKRYSAEITHRWDVQGFSPDEEHPRPEYLAQLNSVEEKTINFVTQTAEPKPPFWTMKLPGIAISASMVLFMIFLGLAAVLGVILYRMAMVAALNVIDEDNIKSHASLFISVTGATINLVCILIFNQIYGYVAEWLTELELNRTQTQFDDSLSLKIYLLQFVNYYASIFYIAFFKGKFIGQPGDYNRLWGFRQEECAPGGCFMELCVQMGILFVGKQFLLSVMEYHLPRIWKVMNTLRVMTGLSTEDKCKYPQWIQDFKLVEWGNQGLFYEYLEMVIQYGFITIFVTAFPLAPLFALLNNVFELRLDAKKLLIHHRRPVAQRVKDIGIWLNILESLGRIAVVTNGLIIAFTSEFIPRLVYATIYSPDHSLAGYTNFTLSYFDPTDFNGRTELPNRPDHPEHCRYYDFRYGPWEDADTRYHVNMTHWHILAARLAFVVVFQNVVALSVMFIKWIIPNMSADLRERIRRETYLTNEIIIRTELLRAAGKLSEDGSSIGEAGDMKPEETDDERTSIIRSRFSRTETGDITDGHIVVGRRGHRRRNPFRGLTARSFWSGVGSLAY